MIRQPYIFVWIPKTGGTSISTALEGSAGMRKIRRKDRAARFDGVGGVTYLHRTIPAMVAAGTVDQAAVDRAFKFAFVRNPWDRFVSLYHYWAKLYWCRKLVRHRPFDYVCDLVSEMGLKPPGDHNLSGFDLAAQQSAWVFDGDRMVVDFVGRFEDLAGGFGEACGRIGVEARLGRLNSSRRGQDYRPYYDDRTAEIVRGMYPDDIRNFGYEFG